jgi:hypothetical protein
MTKQKPPVFNVDCYGIDFDTYQFLLGDIAQGIEDGNRMYGFGEPGYIGADGNFHPLTEPELEAKPKLKPKRYRLKSKSRLRPQIHYRVRPRPKSKPVPLHQLAWEFRG